MARTADPGAPIEVLLVRIVSDAPIVVGMAGGFTSAPLTAEDLDAEVTEARRYLASMAESIKDSPVSAHYQVIEATAPVPRVMLKAARDAGADLIALGSHAKSGMLRFVLGRVSEEILERSPIPVLLVRQKAAAPRVASGPALASTVWGLDGVVS